MTTESLEIVEKIKTNDLDNCCLIDTPIMIVVQKFSESVKLGKRSNDQYFLKDLYLFVDIEPCFMEAMGLTHSRISRVYFKKENDFDGAILKT